MLTFVLLRDEEWQGSHSTRTVTGIKHAHMSIGLMVERENGARRSRLRPPACGLNVAGRT